MKKKLDDLLSIERKYLEQLNQTKEINFRYIENTSENISKYTYNNYVKKRNKKLNKSMDLGTTNYNKKENDSKSGISLSFRNIKYKNDKKDNTTEHTQSSSINIFKVNKNKSVDNKVNNNNINKNIKKNISKKINKSIDKSIDKNVKSRNRENNLKVNKKICKSVVNIKETNKNIKNIRNIKKESAEKYKIRNMHESYVDYLEKIKNKNSIKSTKMKK